MLKNRDLPVVNISVLTVGLFGVDTVMKLIKSYH